MASGEEVETGSSENIFTGTDEEIAFPCSLCSGFDGKLLESVVYCLECAEHLCTTCRQHHRSLKLTRGHHLIEIGKRNSNLTESCPEHLGKSIEYWCETHEVLCCKTCKDIGHSGCDNVKCIQDEANGFEEGAEVLKAGETLKNLTAKLSAQILAKQKQTESITKQVEDALIQIKTERTCSIEQIKKLADEAEKDVQTQCSFMKSQIQNEIDTMESVLETLSATERSMKTIKQSACASQIYITVQKADNQMKKYSVYVEEVTTNLLEPNIKFTLDNTFYSVQNLKAMGVVSVDRVQQEQKRERRSRKVSSRMSLILKRKTAIPIGGHSVRIADDKTTCSISGSEILQDGRIVLADQNNKSVKLFGKNCTFVSHVTLSSRPTDIVAMGEREIATSLIDEKAVQIVAVDSSLRLSECLKTSNHYYGLAYSNNRQLYGSTSIDDGAGEIHVMDMTGKVLAIIKKIDEQIDLVRPTAIRIDNKNQLLYVNDLGSNCVVCFDISNGASQYRQVFTYTDRHLELRSGLALDTDGNVYVSSGNMTVHQMCNGIKVHEILSSADGLGRPQCLAFSENQKILLVSELKENSFKLFALR